MSNPIQNLTDPRVETLKAVLISLEKALKLFSKDIDLSHQLLESGAKSELIQAIDELISDPLNSLNSLSTNIDDQVKIILDRLVYIYFKKNQDVIDEVYRSFTNHNQNLFYSIVLKDDNELNRDKIFDFFDSYPLEKITSKYPIYFQITPKEFVDNIISKQKMVIHEPTSSTGRT